MNLEEHEENTVAQEKDIDLVPDLVKICVTTRLGGGCLIEAISARLNYLASVVPSITRSLKYTRIVSISVCMYYTFS